MSSYTERFSGPEHDLPARPLGELAERCYVLATTPRSGSNLLGDALRTSGGLGVPMEYLDLSAAQPLLASRWRTTDLAGYLAHLHAHRTDPSGWFGLKVHWHQLVDVYGHLSPEPYTDAHAPVLRQVVEQLFPGTRWVHLTRRDTVGQAVSLYRAAVTSQYVQMADDAPAADPPLDREGVVRMVRAHGRLTEYQRAWEAFFLAAGLEPLELRFEDVRTDVANAVMQVRSFLGVGEGEPPQVGTRPQSTADWSGRARAMLEDALHGGAQGGV